MPLSCSQIFADLRALPELHTAVVGASMCQGDIGVINVVPEGRKGNNRVQGQKEHLKEILGKAATRKDA